MGEARISLVLENADQPSKSSMDFDRKDHSVVDVREHLYREILPSALA